jgi:Bacterial proteasome activator
MASTQSAGPGGQPGARDVAAPRLAVVLDAPPEPSRTCRVDAPYRVLRIWGLLSGAVDEMRRAKLPSGAAARLQRQLDAVTAELERSVSPALAGELRHLTHHEHAAAPTADELRVEYASLLGWTGGLVVGMLRRLEAAAKRRQVMPLEGSARGGPADCATGPVPGSR